MNKNNAIRGRNQNASREIGLPIVEIEKMVSKNSKSSGASTTFLTDSNSDYDVKVYIRSVFLDLRNHWKSSSILAGNFLGLKRSLSGNWSIQEHIQIESELTSISTLYICIGILCKWKVQFYEWRKTGYYQVGCLVIFSKQAADWSKYNFYCIWEFNPRSWDERIMLFLIIS